MGQKTNPIGLRLGINRTWDSKWFTTKNFAKWLEEDIVIRRYIKKRLARAGACFSDGALVRKSARSRSAGVASCRLC